jgi:hypothetical protein
VRNDGPGMIPYLLDFILPNGVTPDPGRDCRPIASNTAFTRYQCVIISPAIGKSERSSIGFNGTASLLSDQGMEVWITVPDDRRDPDTTNNSSYETIRRE